MNKYVASTINRNEKCYITNMWQVLLIEMRNVISQIIVLLLTIKNKMKTKNTTPS